MSVIFTRAPLRLSLGGGGTDLPSYYSEHEGFLIAGAIDKYVYLLTHTVFQRRYRMKYNEFEEVERPEDIRHPILRESLCRHWEGDPLEIASLADVPAGTGLGSSGAYTVAVLKSLALTRDTLDKLRHNLLLFFTGESRSASRLLTDQVTRTQADDEAMLANL